MLSQQLTEKETRIRKPKPKHLKALKQSSPYKEIVRKKAGDTDIFDREPEYKDNESCFAQALLNVTTLTYNEIEDLVNRNKRCGEWKRKLVFTRTTTRALKEIGYMKKRKPRCRKLTVEEAYYKFGGDAFYDVAKHLVGINKDGLLVDDYNSLNMFIYSMYQKE